MEHAIDQHEYIIVQLFADDTEVQNSITPLKIYCTQNGLAPLP